jgi:hypothetical protein
MALRPAIDSYRFGEVVIDGISYRKDVLILSDRVIPNWWREAGHSLSIQDLDLLLQTNPKTIVIGTGAFGRMKVPLTTIRSLEDAGCVVIIERSKRACDRFNELQDPTAAAALHLTC